MSDKCKGCGAPIVPPEMLGVGRACGTKCDYCGCEIEMTVTASSVLGSDPVYATQGNPLGPMEITITSQRWGR